MKILGVDPGTLITGFGIIQYEKNKLSYITSGIIKPHRTNDMGERLRIIYDDLFSLIKTYEPDEFAIETAFYGKNIQSTMKIGYARGVSILAAVHNNVHTSEYSPRTIKQAVVGRGGASKNQVQFMITRLLALGDEKKIFDETDALAVAVCHAFKSNEVAAHGSSWKKFVENNPDLIVR
jgi:crossover junction endodeoxyribonuclease RuvC